MNKTICKCCEMKKYMSIDCISDLGSNCPHYKLKDEDQALRDRFQIADLKNKEFIQAIGRDFDKILKKYI